MTLKYLLEQIGELGKSMHLINFSAAGGSLAQVNPISVEWYPLLFLSPTGSHVVKENTTRYSVTLTFVDRLLEDSSNDVDVWSSAISNLASLVRGIRDIPGVVGVEDGYSVRCFTETEALNDRVNGAYAEIRVECMNETICFEE